MPPKKQKIIKSKKNYALGRKNGYQRPTPQSVPRIHWCFRANVEEVAKKEQKVEAAGLYGELLTHCEAFVFQMESGEETGYIHFQGMDSTIVIHV